MAASNVDGNGGSPGEDAAQDNGNRTQARHVTSDDEGHGTTRKRRRKALAQGNDTRVASGKGRPGTESKDYGESKETKNALVAPPAKPMITLSTGFESRYIYHGVDIVGFNSELPNANHVPNGPADIADGNFKLFQDASAGQPKANLTSPVVYVNGGIEFKGFRFSVGYLNATDHTIPSRVEIQNEADSFNRFYDTQTSAVTGQPFNFKVHPYNNTAKLYKEVDINLDYTLGIIAHVLDATAGYNSFIIPDHDFKGTNYQGEALFRLTYKQIPYIQPNITYYRYISDARASEFVWVGQNNVPKSVPLADRIAIEGEREATGPGFVTRETGNYLNGNYVEARIDSAVPLFKSRQFSTTFAPYALVSVNDGYLTKESGVAGTTEFNTFETGFKLPVTVAERFSVTPYFNYGYDISRTHVANDFRGTLAPFKEDVWGGVTFSYHF